MKKILVVEDEEDYQHLIGQVLSESGFEAFYADDGADGLEKAKKELPDIIILDINLPKLNGWEVLKAIRSDADSKLKNIPVIMLTVRGEDADQIRGLDGGADDYVAKPFIPKELLSRVNAVLKRSGDAK
ncbi:MAG: response regulator transcription factor [Elusimicrobia bacterium]|nr:response regulator transcription factor [Elusimicrobiota bacterium]